jgi:hypothetical protein
VPISLAVDDMEVRPLLAEIRPVPLLMWTFLHTFFKDELDW